MPPLRHFPIPSPPNFLNYCLYSRFCQWMELESSPSSSKFPFTMMQAYHPEPLLVEWAATRSIMGQRGDLHWRYITFWAQVGIHTLYNVNLELWLWEFIYSNYLADIFLDLYLLCTLSITAKSVFCLKHLVFLDRITTITLKIQSYKNSSRSYRLLWALIFSNVLHRMMRALRISCYVAFPKSVDKFPVYKMGPRAWLWNISKDPATLFWR